MQMDKPTGKLVLNFREHEWMMVGGMKITVDDIRNKTAMLRVELTVKDELPLVIDGMRIYTAAASGNETRVTLYRRKVVKSDFELAEVILCIEQVTARVATISIRAPQHIHVLRGSVIERMEQENGQVQKLPS
jgi:sRNA-binding carbon storage regulator CsrA